MDRLTPQPWMTEPDARAVLDALGGEARFVGGCVRNAVMGLAAEDVDLATPLTPDRVIAAVEAAGLRAAPTGIAHGTVTVVSGRRPFEVTTLRRDVETDGRRAVVAFTRDWAEDAARRDFRLNALYADLDGALHDPVGGGVADALAGRIVFVGEADTRIREDYLRILRFFRFTAWYGRGDPHPESLDACARLKAGLASLSRERVGKETLRLLAAPDPRFAVRLMSEAGVLAEVLPDAVAIDRFAALVPVSPEPLLRLAALLPDDLIALTHAAERLRLSNAERDRLLASGAATEVTPSMSEQALRAAIHGRGAQAVRDRLLLTAAEGKGDPAPLLAVLDAWTPSRLPVTGADLVAAGQPPGPEVGATLRRLEEAWVASDFRLDREALLSLL